MSRKRWALPLVLTASAAGAIGQTTLLIVVNVLMLDRTHSAPAVAALWIVPQAALLATDTKPL